MANGTRRALTGNLTREGYLPIRRLMIHRGQHYITLIALHEREINSHKPYWPVLKDFSRDGRSMLTSAPN
jgi:hypothetical protein